MVHISSGRYTFRLDKREPLGMITPIWSRKHPAVPNRTSFFLELSESGIDLADHTRGIRPSLLLFLRKLRAITIQISTGRASKNETVELRRHDDSGGVVTLERLVDGRNASTEKYIMVKDTLEAYPDEEKRKGITESEIVLAFPVTAAGMPDVGKQNVHAFLPLRDYGFRVREVLYIFVATLPVADLQSVCHSRRFLDVFKPRRRVVGASMEHCASPRGSPCFLASDRAFRGT